MMLDGMNKIHNRRQRVWLVVPGVLLLLLLLLLPAVVSCRRQGPATPSSVEVPEAVVLRLGLADQAPSVLAILAAKLELFAAEGVRVEVRHFVSGKVALEALLDGRVDLATTAAVPIVFQSFNRQDFCIIATIASVTGEQRVVARRSAGISAPGDLRGKRIGVQRASAAHYFVHMFLLHNGMNEDDLALEFISPSALIGALATGEIDAFAMREPFVGDALKQIGEDELTLFSAPGIYTRTENLVVSKDVLASYPRSVEAFLRALTSADDYARRLPGASIRLLAEELAVDESVTAQLWDEFKRFVRLDQALFNQLENQARWAIREDLVDAVAVPDYGNLICPGPLARVRPEAVTIIR